MRNNTINIGRWEVISFLLNSLCARVFLSFPRNIIEDSGNAAWIQVIYVTMLAFLLFFIIEKLYSKFPGKDILSISEQLGGSFVRIIVGLIYLFSVIYAGFYILREYAENMKIIALPSSPVSYVVFFFLIGMVIASYAGIEAIVRFHAIVVPIIAVTYLFIVASVMPFFDNTHFFPILGNGARSIFINGFFSLSMYGPIFYIYLMPPLLKTHKNFKASGYIGLGLSAFFLVCSSVVYTAVVPYPTSTEYYVPAYQLARMINFGRFFQRVESIFFLAWSATALMYLSAILYLITDIFSKTFKLQYRKPMILPFAIIILNLSLIPPNLMTVLEIGIKYYSYFIWAVVFILPIVLLVPLNIKTKSSKGDINNE